MTRKTLFLLSFLLLSPLFSSAQFSGVGEPLQFTLRPERPAPFDSVSITLESFVTDLSVVDIIWVVNNEVVSRGGERRVIVNAGPPGGSVKVVVHVSAPDGNSFSKELRIRPAEVMLLWQSEGYAPPFYKGKALAPYQGRVTVVALPSFVAESGRAIDPRQLIYSWSENGEPVIASSGLGKDTFVFRGRVPIRPVSVDVTVTTADKTLVAEAGDTIATQEPSLLLYENHPRYGIRFNQALGPRVTLEDEELNISAVPFFFEAAKRNAPNLRYEWGLNFDSRVVETSPSITLRRAGDEGGESAIALTLQEEEHMFQAGRASATIVFSQRTLPAEKTEP